MKIFILFLLLSSGLSSALYAAGHSDVMIVKKLDQVRQKRNFCEEDARRLGRDIDENCMKDKKNEPEQDEAANSNE